MSTTVRTILLIAAVVLLVIAALAVAGWALDDANPAAFALLAAACYVTAQIP